MRKDLYIHSTLMDGIRIFAAWCVLLGHTFSFFQLSIFKDEKYFPALQNLAVIIFFALAGFLMVYSLEKKEQTVTWKSYVIHQGKRIYRIYIPSLIFVALIDGMNIIFYSEQYQYYDSFNLRTFITNLLMLQNINIGVIIPRFGSNRPLWTMAIEWWLYVIFSFFYIKFYKQRCKNLGSIIVAVFWGIIFVKYIYSGLAVSFMLGMIVCCLYKKYIKTPTLIYSAGVVIAICAVLGIGIFMKNAYIMPNFILIPFIVWFILEIGRRKCDITSKNSYLRRYARSTFALYLIHYPIMELFMNVNIPRIWKVVCIIVVSNIFAIILTLVFDKDRKERSL